MNRDSARESQNHHALVCPECHYPLDSHDDHVSCRSCSRRYPVWLGIPDFRPERTPDGCWDEDRILPALADRYHRTDAEGLLGTLLECIEDKTPEQRETLRRYYMGELAERAQHRRALVEHLHRRAGLEPDYSQILEIGCGTGATLFEFADQGSHAVGVDPNLLHLIIAKKRAEELGLDVDLVCGFAEGLPFQAEKFTLVNFMHTYEHFSDQARGLEEVGRVTAPGGAVSFDVPNRFSLWREPHTRLWGIGFLPRRFTALSRIRNRTIWGLKGAADKVFGEDYELHSMLVRFEVSGYRGGRFVQSAADALRSIESMPVVGSCVRAFQPGFEVIGWKPTAV